MNISGAILRLRAVGLIRLRFVECVVITFSFIGISSVDCGLNIERTIWNAGPADFAAKAYDGDAGPDDLIVKIYWGTPHDNLVNKQLNNRVNVPANYLFETDDQIQIDVVSKRKGYVYILTSDAGGPDIIFPFYDKNTKVRNINQIDPGQTVTAPSKTEFGLIKWSGPITFYVVVAEDPSDPISTGLGLIVDKHIIGLGDDNGQRLFSDIKQRAIPGKYKLPNKVLHTNQCVEYGLSASGPSPLVMQFTLEHN